MIKIRWNKFVDEKRVVDIEVKETEESEYRYDIYLILKPLVEQKKKGRPKKGEKKTVEFEKVLYKDDVRELELDEVLNELELKLNPQKNILKRLDEIDSRLLEIENSLRTLKRETDCSSY